MTRPRRHLRPPRARRPSLAACLSLGLSLGLVVAAAVATPAQAAPAPQRTRLQLPATNGHGAILLDLEQARLVQFREHLFAAEEPVLDANDAEVWDGEQFATVHTRDLLFDAYFGVRAEGEQLWLSERPVDLDASGYATVAPSAVGGSGVVVMTQQIGALRATTRAFAPQGLPAGAFVLVLTLENTGPETLTDVAAFSLHNFHLGFGRPPRPWDVGKDIAANGETLDYDASGGKARFRERGFAGVIVTRALGTIAHHGVGPDADLYAIVKNGAPKDFPDNAPPVVAVADSVSGLQWDLGDLAPATAKSIGVIAMHDPDPFAGLDAQATLDEFVAGKDASGLLAAELAAWAALQTALKLPADVDADEEALLRQGAAMLHMGQVQESSYFLREFLSKDGEPRRTRFKGPDDEPVTLPATVKHRGKGAVLASLPPGEWTYAWIRDGAYATAAMAALGMTDHALAALNYYLDAEAGRFQNWTELQPYALPPYQISLVRYHGFGVEETDFNDFGPNLEFDGFGLFLWALRATEALTGDTSVADARWPEIRDRVADVLLALIDPDTGLVRADSSIWETHWNGRQRHFAYTSITAARGLCDAAAIAGRLGDDERAQTYQAAGEALRAAIAAKLTDRDGALASNLEELATGEGYRDAAVLDAIAMGLFDPHGTIAAATLQGLDEHLRVDAGPGWSRNDDRWDHGGVDDLSPWGSDYDSAEWVVTDLRGAVALRMAGDEARADALTDWVRDQAHANYLMVAETYDELAGTYKFNAPMLGFGAGAYALALAHRAGMLADPACGAYFDEGEDPGTGTDTDADPTTTTDVTTEAITDTITPSSGDDPTAAPPTTSPDESTTVDATATAGLDTDIGSSGAATTGESVDSNGCACRSEREGRGGLRGADLLALSLLSLLSTRRRRSAVKP